MPSGFRPFVSPDSESGTVTGETADMSSSATDVSVHIKPSVGASMEFIIESSVDGDNFVQSSPTLSAETVWFLPRGVPYHRVRVTSWVSGTIWAKYGPIQGRNRELGNISSPPQTAGGPQ